MADIELVKVLFSGTNQYAERNHSKLLNMLLAPFHLASSIKKPEIQADVNKAVDEYASQVLEEYHTKIEASAIPILDFALKGDLRFYDDDRCIPFLYFLATQYMRTKALKSVQSIFAKTTMLI